MIIGETAYKNVHGFTDAELQRMRDYLLGAVQAWCRDRHGEWFAARDLLGGANYYWQGTPLIRLYDYYMEQSDQDDEYSVRQAGRALDIYSKGCSMKIQSVFTKHVLLSYFPDCLTK